jgi:N-acetylmuramoyl-L-alanine amidase
MRKVLLFTSASFFILLSFIHWIFFDSSSLPKKNLKFLQDDLQWKAEMSRWRAIVIHHSASLSGNAHVFHSAHLAKGWDELGYHFVIGNGQGSPDGFIEVGSRWKKQKHGAHAGDTEYNQQGIGICLVGNFEEQKPTVQQWESLLDLIEALRKLCSISLEEIRGHGEIKETLCPGQYLSVEALKKELQQRQRRKS